jgi:hypothetical protein
MTVFETMTEARNEVAAALQQQCGELRKNLLARGCDAEHAEIAVAAFRAAAERRATDLLTAVEAFLLDEALSVSGGDRS